MQRREFVGLPPAVLGALGMRGVLRGPLHGLPVLIKDNIETRDGLG